MLRRGTEVLISGKGKTEKEILKEIDEHISEKTEDQVPMPETGRTGDMDFDNFPEDF